MRLTSIIKIYAACLLFVFPLGGIASADTLSNNVLYLYSSNDGNTLTISDPEVELDYNWVLFSTTVSTASEVEIGNIEPTAGDPFSIYLVSAGATFDPNYVNDNTPVITNLGGSNSGFSVPTDTPFYLAVWQGDTSFDDGRTFKAEPGDSYGWGEFEYDTSGTNAGLELLGTENAYPSSGIVAGTSDYLAVPEPSSWTLIMVSTAVLCGLKEINRRKKARTV